MEEKRTVFVEGIVRSKSDYNMPNIDYDQGLNLLGGIVRCCEQCSLP
ncbi:MAG: hypothetical protein GXY17_10830 [Clostridiaceae bacterium]|nr:hypothetical protein [Clostridiaceae bacterium]